MDNFEFVSPSRYTVRLDDRSVFYPQANAMYRIETCEILTVLDDKLVPPELREDVLAGARKVLAQEYRRDPRNQGSWQKK